MTIDEKIQDFRQLEYDFEHSMCDTEDDKENLMKYQQEYEYYKQLAEWLEELKRRREHDGEIIGSGALNNAYNQGYNKALDDFLAKLKERWREDCNCLVSNCGELRCEDCEIEFCRYTDCVAEQLKEGGSDE